MTHSLPDLLQQAGLDGRGGAGFPTAVKVARAQERRADLIVNGCDGELGSEKDAYVLARHLPEVLDAVRLLRPRRWQVAVHREAPVRPLLEGQGVPVLSVPDRYVSSESSALVALAHGRPAKPVGPRVRTVLGGRDGHGRRLRPTLVLNAETVLRISQIHTRGPAWFRSFGTAAEPGPRLITVNGAVTSPGVFETQAGADLVGVLALAGPVAPGPVLVGGLAGGWVTAAQVPGTRWSRAGLARHGAAPGAGVIRVLHPGSCPLEYTARLTAYAAGQSAGQCGPCMFGLPAVADALGGVVAGDPRGHQQLSVLLGQVRGRGGCSFPDGVVTLVESTLAVFAEDVGAHARGHCLAVPAGAAR